MSIQTFECPCSKEASPSTQDAPGYFFSSADATRGPNSDSTEDLSIDPVKLVGMGYAIEKDPNIQANEVRQAIKARAAETPWETFRYAMAFGHADIADSAAPYTVGRLPTKNQCIHDLPAVVQLAWYKYREQYLLLLDAVVTQPPLHKNTKRKLHDCGGWEPYAAAVLGDLPGTPLFNTMSDIAVNGAGVVFSRSRWDREIVPPGWDSECLTCRERAEKWEGAVNRRFRKLENFSVVLQKVKSGPGNG